MSHTPDQAPAPEAVGTNRRSAPEAPVLEVSDLTVGVGRNDIVHGVDFAVAKGQTLGIVGESGSGKSLSVLSATGLFEAPGGYVHGSSTLDGEQIVGAPAGLLRSIHGRRIGFVFQDPSTSLNPLMTVEAQLAEGPMKHLGISVSEARERSLKLLTELGLPDPELRLGYYPHQLSGGQKQRVMIAVALACEPEVLIADEPTTALDVTTQAGIIDLVAGLQRSRDMAVIWISHDLGVIGQIADDVVVMREGEIVERGSVADIFERPQHEYTMTLLAARPLLRTQQDAGTENTHADREEQGDPLLRIQDLTVDFEVSSPTGKRTITAVKDVSLDVYRGRTLGIVGESGSGKSTIANVLTGVVEPASGDARMSGGPVLGLSGADLKTMRRRIAMVFQDPFAALDPRMTVQRSIAEPLMAHDLVPRRKRRERCAQLLEQVGLDESFIERYPHELSGGQRQRVCIARALAVDPELLILDESTASLDVSIQAQVLDLLAELQDEHGFGYIFIGHDLAVVEQVSDTVAVMKDGEVVEYGTAEQILREPQTDYTRQLIDAVPPAEPVRA